MAEEVAEETLALIRRFEGLRLKPYRCPAGVWTIGYGSTRIDGKRVTAQMGPITQGRADDLLRLDAGRCQRAVSRMVNAPLTDGQIGALVDFSYNLGAGALQASTLLRKINGGDWHDVPAQFMRWVHASGRVEPGLVRRRQAEIALWLTPPAAP